MGWGYGPWGAVEWGAGEVVDLRLIRAQPYRENVVRLTFNTAPLFTGDLGPNDASNPERFNVVPIEESNLGEDPRNVDPVFVERAAVELSAGAVLDLWVDRPFDPFPSLYLVSANQIVTSSGGLLLNANFTSLQFDGLFCAVPPPIRANKLPVRDIANPQTRSALFDPLPYTDDELILGTIPVDDQGDYAFDEGIANIRKRIFRRLVTSKGKFAHLPGYGIGFPDQLKRLGTASARAELAAETQAQISEEPDVERVVVRVIVDPQRPELYRLRIRVKVKVSDEPVNVDVPFSPIGS